MTLTKWFPVFITLFSLCAGFSPLSTVANQDTSKLRAYSHTQSCRADGFFCSNDLECCGVCRTGVCDNGSTGGGSCRQDGSACRNDLECCGTCRSGVCDSATGGGTCRPDGLACHNDLECCNICRSSVCSQ